MIIAAAPPMIAILLAQAALGWLGFKLNMFLNVMTPLIMVISFSDSHAADLCGARPADRGRRTNKRIPQRDAGGRAGLRADPCHRRLSRLSRCNSPIPT